MNLGRLGEIMLMILNSDIDRTKLPHVRSEWSNLIWWADISPEFSYIYPELLVRQKQP